MTSEKEAELIGMHVGDGTLYRTNRLSIVWEMRGSIHEQGYYAYVAQLIKDVLNVEVKPKYRGPNSYGIQTCNKTVTQFFVNKGFNPGKKVYTVRIPDFIKTASAEVQFAFIRGLFDTDGCIYFDKNRTKYQYYPRLEFAFASLDLRDDLCILFQKLQFKVHKWNNFRKDGGSEYRVSLAGFSNLKKWTENIRPGNSKHLNRIKVGLLNKDKVALKSISKNV